MTEHVTAEVIDTELTPQTAGELWLAGVRERAARLAEQYQPHEIADDADYKASKTARADARKDVAAIEAERKAQTRAVEDFVRDFKAGAKEAIAPLLTIDAAYKEHLDEYERKWALERRAELEGAYADMAPDLTELVPFDRLLARYGQERGKGWLNRSTNVVIATSSLQAAIEDVAQGERTVEGAVAAEDAEAAKADFFSTLDATAAIAAAQARAEQRERVRRLEEERRAREAEAARIEAEHEAARQAQEEARTSAEALERAKPTINVRNTMTAQEFAEEYEQVMGAPAPSLAAHIAQAMGQPTRGSVPPLFFCGYGNEQQANAFMEWARRNGVKPTKLPTHGHVMHVTETR